MVEIVNIYVYVTDFSSPRQVRLPHSPHNQIEAERRGKWQKLLLRINGEWNLTESKNHDKDILMSHFGPLFIVVFSLMFAISSIRNCIEKVVQTKRIIEVVIHQLTYSPCSSSSSSSSSSVEAKRDPAELTSSSSEGSPMVNESSDSNMSSSSITPSSMKSKLREPK